jgi:hypothetical protein
MAKHHPALLAKREDTKRKTAAAETQKRPALFENPAESGVGSFTNVWPMSSMMMQNNIKWIDNIR